MSLRHKGRETLDNTLWRAEVLDKYVERLKRARTVISCVSTVAAEDS